MISLSEKIYTLNIFHKLSGIGLRRYIEEIWTIPSEENMQTKEGGIYTRLAKVFNEDLHERNSQNIIRVKKEIGVING
jgi:hypothetical protein